MMREFVTPHVHRFHDVTIGQLAALYEAYNLAKLVLLGVAEQPRASGVASQMLEDEMEAMQHKTDIVSQAMAAMPRPDVNDKKQWAEVVVAAAMTTSDSLQPALDAVLAAISGEKFELDL